MGGLNPELLGGVRVGLGKKLSSLGQSNYELGEFVLALCPWYSLFIWNRKKTQQVILTVYHQDIHPKIENEKWEK